LGQWDADRSHVQAHGDDGRTRAGEVVALPFPGGRVRFPDGGTRYPDGRHAWRCAGCGNVAPWSETHGGYWSLLQEEDGLFADHGRGYPVWCSVDCYKHLVDLGECSDARTGVVVTRKRQR
jgi:hypothetical protein